MPRPLLRSLARGLLRAAVVVLACTGALAARASAQQAPAARPTRVLLLYGLAPDSPTASLFIERLRTALRSELPTPVEIYAEFPDLDRFPDPGQPQRLARYLGDKYRGLGIDVVVAAGAVALQFATAHLGDRLPGVPVVFGLVQAENVDTSALPANVTGRLFSVSLGRTLTMARHLQPGLERVYVIAGSSGIDSILLADALGSLGPMRDSVRVVVRQGLPFDVLRAELRRLPPRSSVFFAHLRRDGRGRIFVPVEALTTLAREARAPTYHFMDRTIGAGVIGGAMVRHDEEATYLGRLAVRVLRRPPGAPLPPVELVESPFVADWRVLRRFHLDERRLPPGTEVRFRVLSPWERHRGVVLTALVLMAAQSLLIGTLLVERRARRRAQQALRDQSAYERTMAELTTDAVRHAPEDAPSALEDALARVGAYAGADAAVLVQAADGPARPAIRRYWMRQPGPRVDDVLPAAPSSDAGASRLELPLVVGGTRVGTLELYRTRPGEGWPAALAARLGGAAEVIAGAIARSRAAAATEEAQRQVAHLGRVAVVGELGSTISHELRQPLTAISMNAQVAMRLLREPRLDLEEATEALADVLSDARRAEETIEQIRLMLRKQRPDTTAVDLNAVSRHAVSLLQRDATARGVRLIVALEPGLPPVRGNAVELRQVVLNLALNALDALDAVDAVTAGVGKRTVVIGTVAAGDSVTLSVRDTGPGLPPEVAARLFDPFFTTKAHGLGMGLAIVRTLVQQHGGDVVAENHAEGGAVFRVVLPASILSHDGASRDRLAVLATS